MNSLKREIDRNKGINRRNFSYQAKQLIYWIWLKSIGESIFLKQKSSDLKKISWRKLVLCVFDLKKKRKKFSKKLTTNLSIADLSWFALQT